MDTIIVFAGWFIIITGWFVVYFLGKRQDAINKRKELRIKYLIETWQLLESISNRENNDLLKNLEKVIADIQLFGSKQQIKLAQDIANEMKQRSNAGTLDLLKNLRTDLRKELDLEQVPETFKFLRIK